MSDVEKQANDLLKIFPLRTREILRILCRKSCRTEIQELIWTIEARGAGRLPDIGENAVNRLIPLDQMPEIHRAAKLDLSTVASEFESPDL